MYISFIYKICIHFDMDFTLFFNKYYQYKLNVIKISADLFFIYFNLHFKKKIKM